MDVETPPQPSLSAPSPPTGGAAKRSRKRSKAIVVFGITALIALVVMIALYQRRKADRARAIGHLRSLGLSLREFESDYGSFPDRSTATTVTTGTAISISHRDQASNDFFKQLIEAQIIQAEELFHVRSRSYGRPDNVFKSDATMLAEGECDIIYIEGLSAAEGAAPLLIAPALPGMSKFDVDALDHQVVVLQVDGTVVTYPIDDSGKITGPGGMDLLDPRQPFWHGKTPNLKWPK